MNKAVQAYLVAQSLGDLKEGTIVHLDSEKAQALVDAGFLSEASEEDVNGQADDDTGDDAEVMADDQAVTRAIAQLSKNLEGSIARATEAAVSKVSRKAPALTIPASPKKEVFRCLGEMLLATVKARSGDHRAMRQLEAHQEEIRLKAPLGANEGTAGQGGYAVKPQWYSQIYDKVREYPKLLDKTERIITPA